MNAERPALREFTKLSIVKRSDAGLASRVKLLQRRTEQSGELCTPKLTLVEVLASNKQFTEMKTLPDWV